MEGITEKKEPLFKELRVDENDTGVTEIESLCVECEEEGKTKLLLTKIPFFKDVILSSFECEHCGNTNNDIQPTEPFQDKGIRITTIIKNQKDLNRKIVKQSSASFSIPELQFESEAFTQKGVMTNVEGLLQNAIDGLEQQQPLRRIMEPAVAEKIDEFVGKLKTYCSGEKEFTLVIDDISGNSFVENINAPLKDEDVQIEYFTRSKEQNEKLGIPEETSNEEEKLPYNSGHLDLSEEVLHFPSNCQNCQSPAETNMKVVRIPHFKEVVIMATNCDSCGYRSNEVKSGGGIEPLGTRITLKMAKSIDLSRDVLKSETCDVSIPELEFEIRSGTIGGKFTTVEGLLVNFKEQMQTLHPFAIGDSSSQDEKGKFNEFIEKLEKAIRGEIEITLILDDPVGNSYIQNPYSPEEDPDVTVEKYERTFEQNEELGLNDIDTGETSDVINEEKKSS